METLDLVMRVLTGLAGAFLLYGAAYMFTAAVETRGVGLAEIFFGSVGVLALGFGLTLVYVAFKPESLE